MFVESALHLDFNYKGEDFLIKTMSTSFKQLIVFAISTLMIAGCHSSKNLSLKEEKIIELPNAALLQLPWELISLNGKLIHAQMGRNPYIKFDHKNVSGNAGCNTYSANYMIQKDKNLVFDSLIITKMTCPDIVVEHAFLQSLQQTTSYLVQSDTLILFNAERIITMKLLSVADIKE